MAKAKKAKIIPETAIARINSSFNNTIVTITTREGDTIS